jgi:LacI family gluconate utilization system Gnt-I transcriptional repressor
MMQLGEYLVQSGSRKIAFVGEHHDFNTRGSARRQAYLDLLVKHKLGEPRIIETGEPPITMEQGRLAFREIIASWSDIDTIMCVSDPPAFGVLSEAKRMGFDIPSQIKVTGFGDFEISRSSYPSITTIAIDVEDLGKRVGEIVVASIEAMRNNIDFAPIIAALTAKLIIRETT